MTTIQTHSLSITTNMISFGVNFLAADSLWSTSSLAMVCSAIAGLNLTLIAFNAGVVLREWLKS